MKGTLLSLLAVFMFPLFATAVMCEDDTKEKHRMPVAQSKTAQHPNIDASAESMRFLHGKTHKAGLQQSRGTPVRSRRIETSGLLGILRRVPQQYPTIQAGIVASVNGDTVLVSEGNYFENIDYSGKRIIVASLYLLDQDTLHISRTIIDGSQATSPQSVVSFISGEDTNSVLCGFTVRGGSGTDIPPTFDERDGGGVILWESSGRLVRNIITGNRVLAPSAWGGGVSMTGLTNTGQTLIMENNVVSRNSATATTSLGFGGGVSIFQSQFRLTGNVFEHDTVRGVVQAGASGVAVYLSSGNLGVISGSIFRNNIVLGDSSSYACLTIAQYDGDVVIDSNLFEDNSVMSMNRSAYGGAIHVDDYYTTSLPEKRITRNVIRRNRLTSNPSYTFGGAMFLWDARVRVAENLIEDNASQAGIIAYGGGIYGIRWGGTIENNIIAGNIGTAGGGIGHYGGPPLGTTQAIMNNTFSRNQAEFGGGLSDGGGGTISVLLNNIFWDDSSSNGEIYAVGSIEVHYSNIEGGWSGGTGNINVNPMFIDSLYRIAGQSPCVAAGTDSMQIGGVWYNAPRTDYFGNPRPRPVGTRPDIGAHEFQTTTGVENMSDDPATFALSQNYPNPFNPVTNFQFSIGSSQLTILKVYDILGREVATLVNEEKSAGSHSVSWDASGMASGVYFYRLTAGSLVETKKLVVMR